jgi:glutaredoxin
MRTVKVYTKEGCQFSAQLKAILEAREIPYEETVMTLDSPEHHELGERTGSMRLPQAFIGAIPLGSTQEVQAAAANGMLMDLVADY